jgi:hypothetical protein
MACKVEIFYYSGYGVVRYLNSLNSIKLFCQQMHYLHYKLKLSLPLHNNNFNDVF